MNNKKTVMLSESKLREMIIEAVKDTLNNINNKLEDFHNGYTTKEGNPTSIEDVFEGDGWKVVKSFNKNGSTYYAVKRMTGFLGEFYGVEDMTEELNIFLNGNGTASYAGKHPKYNYIELYKIDF